MFGSESFTQVEVGELSIRPTKIAWNEIDE